MLEDALGPAASALACLDNALANPAQMHYWIARAKEHIREWQRLAMAWSRYPYQRRNREVAR